MGILGDIQTWSLRLWLGFKSLVVRGKAEPYLGALSFFESFLIAVPVDPFLAAMVVADRSRWVRVAAIATATSTAGAAVGYLLGFFAFDLIGSWFFSHTSASAFIAKLVALFADHAVVLTFAAALTPIPNGPIVIAAGFVGTHFFWFLLAWGVARAMRFFGVAYIVYAFGTTSLSITERIINSTTIAFILVIIGWFVYRAAGI